MIPWCGRVLILFSSLSRNCSTISPMVRTFTTSPRSVLVRSSMYRSCARPSASSSPAGEGSGKLPLGRFKTNRCFWFVSLFRKWRCHLPPFCGSRYTYVLLRLPPCSSTRSRTRSCLAIEGVWCQRGVNTTVGTGFCPPSVKVVSRL